jgi:flagellar protein FliL
MKKLLIILLVLLLLGGGGAAAWWFYFRTDPDAPPPPPPPKEFVELTIPEEANDALVINVIKNGKVEKHFFFRFTLIFDAPEKRDKASKLMPALINDFNEELHALLARKLVEESKYDLNLIQKQLQKVCDRRLGLGTVNQVSISNMEQRE